MELCVSTRMTRSPLALVLSAIAGCIFIAAQPVRADTVFSNIVGNCCGGVEVSGGTASESLAESFTPNAQYALTDAKVEVFAVQGGGGTPDFNVSLFSNASGVPGSLISTIESDVTATATGGIVTASGGTPELLEGTEYWLVLTPSSSTTAVGWETGGSPAAPYAITSSPTGVGGWIALNTNTLQFQIDGTPAGKPGLTPEPASLALVFSGALGLVGMVRRRTPRLSKKS